MRFIYIASILLLFFGCRDYTGTEKEYSQAIFNAQSDLPLAHEFASLYPLREEFISYFTGKYGQPKWNSKIGLHGRYIVTMQFPIQVNGSRLQQIGEPEFLIVEVERIERLPDGRYSIHYRSESQRRFGIEGWRLLVEANGDISVLGIEVKVESPHPDFDDVWKAG